MVDTFCNLYEDVGFVVPDAVMSAGTILVQSGDDVYMDCFSVPGPGNP